MSFHLIRAMLLGCCLLPAAFGCNRTGGLSLVPVSGTVTYQGKPLDHGNVVFAPQEGTLGPQAVGNIDSKGYYEMTTTNRPGAVVGGHKVTVHCRDKPILDSKELYTVYPSLIPERYSREEESPLKIEVPSQGITYDISLE